MKIYADNAATTKMCTAAIDAMLPFWTGSMAIPPASTPPVREAAEALAEARQRIAACIGADPGELVFTSGGSEADNQALPPPRSLGCSGASGISSPLPLNTMPSCTPWRSSSGRASRSPFWMCTRTVSSSPAKWRRPSGQTPAW